MLKLDKIEDPRSPLEKVRRADLKKIIRASGVPVDLDLPAEHLREVIKSNPQIMKGFRIIESENPAVIDSTVQITHSVQKMQESYAGLNRFQLMRVCKSRGIKTSTSDTIDSLKAKLNG